MFILSAELILQPSHFSFSWLLPHSFPSCSVPHCICLSSPARPQESSFSWLRIVKAWRSYWESCLGPLLTWLLGLYLLHRGLSNWSLLTIASGVSRSFTHSCFKAFISLPPLCFQAVYPPFLSFRHPLQGKKAASTLPLLGFPPFQYSHNTVVLPVPFTAMFLISFSISTASLRGVTWWLSAAAVLSPVLQMLRQWKTFLSSSSFLLKAKATSSVDCSCHLLKAISILYWPLLHLKNILSLYLPSLLCCCLIPQLCSFTYLTSLH